MHRAVGAPASTSRLIRQRGLLCTSPPPTGGLLTQEALPIRLVKHSTFVMILLVSAFIFWSIVGWADDSGGTKP